MVLINVSDIVIMIGQVILLIENLLLGMPKEHFVGQQNYRIAFNGRGLVLSFIRCLSRAFVA